MTGSEELRQSLQHVAIPRAGVIAVAGPQMRPAIRAGRFKASDDVGGSLTANRRKEGQDGSETWAGRRCAASPGRLRLLTSSPEGRAQDGRRGIQHLLHAALRACQVLGDLEAREAGLRPYAYETLMWAQPRQRSGKSALAFRRLGRLA
jgi:hypothetical protein